MKAMIYTTYGPPEVLHLTEIAKPTPKANEVLVRIHATAVTSGDCRIRKADPFGVRLLYGLRAPKRTILGSELAGEVEAVGSAVTRFRPGDQVFGFPGRSLGAYAQYICLAEDRALTHKPTTLSYEEATVLPFGGNTALYFLRKGQIRRGQQVLIYGASGSVGTAAVQLAKHFGAEVTAVCSTANIALVKSLGADTVVDYTQEDVTTSGGTFDIIFDTIGKSPFAGSLRSLKHDGRYLRAVHMSPGPVLRGLWTSLTSSKKVIGGVATERQADLEFLKALSEAGELRPVIDRSYPLERIAEAHRYVDTGHKKGDVVITVAHPSAA